MGKATAPNVSGKINTGKRDQSRPPLPPVIAQADIPEAQLQRFEHEVKQIANPYGEVTFKGEIRQHKACRRVAHFETLYRSKVFDRGVFVVLEWYAERLSLANAGLFKSGLANPFGGGGGSGASHTPMPIASVEARSDIKWARSFVPADLLVVLDCVMEQDETFETIGAKVFPSRSLDRSKRKASAMFKLAANYLLLGIGSRVMGAAS